MDMDMGMSSTTTAASATPTGAMMGGGMDDDMGMGMGPAGMCKISMLWNWNVLDTCFISSSWQITSKGMFAGSCIGVVLLVIALEFLRRLSKEYDGFLIKQHAAKFRNASAPAVVTTTAANTAVKAGGESVNSQDVTRAAGNAMPPFRPNVLQQAARALLHMVQFAIAYFVMLLAMYYNGYFIICIFIGAYIGAFIFQWETLTVGSDNTSATNNPTVCCG
ncbi:ctr copper transporter family domain-containing protein [Trichoderma breve]|uniref:Copper transport protein n=1 Tax=Trichoderma breve TaxID=2034170 RepID=A0A9W9E917_9HYPO|nr:ctr copper transporter family domain-containing protein [Trichoderma breve]KAJ4862280.1 ctr copper transporter family domain-containing protein [Trichoderma breve]